MILNICSASVLAHQSGQEYSSENVIVTRHFSGLWEHSGQENQGFTLHVLHQYSGERIASAFWFTYDADQQPEWLFGFGPIEENRIELDLYRVSDVAFLQPDDPEVNPENLIGSAVMAFDSCQTGTVTFDTDLPEYGAGSIEIEQFGWILNTHCSGGMSDDMPADARFGQQTLELQPAKEGIHGTGHARHESYPNHIEFEVEVEGLQDGQYHLYVGMHQRAEFAVIEGHGRVRFSSPFEDGYKLLNFEPRGQRLAIHNGTGAVLSSFDNMMEEDDHSGYRGHHGDGHGGDDGHHYACEDSGMGGQGHGMGGGHGGADCVEEGDFIELDIDLENTGALADARGEAGWEMNTHRVRFSVEIEDIPVGNYPLRVAGEVLGLIEANEMHQGGVIGRISFRDPETYGINHLDFDPRGQLVEVLHGESVILRVEFPEE
jgi:hypothetical protein